MWARDRPSLQTANRMRFQFTLSAPWLALLRFPALEMPKRVDQGRAYRYLSCPMHDSPSARWLPLGIDNMMI